MTKINLLKFVSLLMAVILLVIGAIFANTGSIARVVHLGVMSRTLMITGIIGCVIVGLLWKDIK